MKGLRAKRCLTKSYLKDKDLVGKIILLLKDTEVIIKFIAIAANIGGVCHTKGKK